LISYCDIELLTALDCSDCFWQQTHNIKNRWRKWRRLLHNRICLFN